MVCINREFYHSQLLHQLGLRSCLTVLSAVLISFMILHCSLATYCELGQPCRQHCTAAADYMARPYLAAVCLHIPWCTEEYVGRDAVNNMGVAPHFKHFRRLSQMLLKLSRTCLQALLSGRQSYTCFWDVRMGQSEAMSRCSSNRCIVYCANCNTLSLR